VTQGFTQLARTVRADLAQENRYAHSVRVARLSESLALAHGEDTGSARVAGMLHDLARLYSTDRLLRECSERGMSIDAFERAHPIVLHARLSAELARDRYGVEDEAILSEIRAHTLGNPRMSGLDEVLYLADGLEPCRDFPEREACLRAAYRALDEGMRMLLALTVDHQRRRGLDLAPQTLSAMERYAAPGAGAPPREERGMEDRVCRT
jgi:predicted HD superfamily hydrolase involved in NAD metabolism